MRGYAAIGLFNPKTPANVGSVLRAAHVFGAALVVSSPGTSRYHRSPTDVQCGYRHIPFQQVNNLKEAIPFDCIPVAVELLEDAKDLRLYKHPERAFYVFGPEDGSLGKEVVSWCRDIVYIPSRYCLNLSATVNVVLYDRLTKEL